MLVIVGELFKLLMKLMPLVTQRRKMLLTLLEFGLLLLGAFLFRNFQEMLQSAMRRTVPQVVAAIEMGVFDELWPINIIRDII